ncbi:hypothetical protein B0H17DRAFT_1334496 [Mycena rosella]|uniref:Uncharacterized protein n=1 Tax=Mycena rosella TaxID=1033263 RepID=A0AAD7G813_MYCRO|nr:hypothetical protein B0H17DRAFT_1334496 [Mycena rosella]
MKNGIEWLPHTGTQPVKLPPILSSAGGSSKGPGKILSWNAFGKWLKGRDTVMDIELDPDEFEAYTKRWALKWHYFQETFPETSQENVDGMGRDEIGARITWLTDYEILAGVASVANPIENCQPDLISVLTGSKANATLTEQTSQELGSLVGQLKTMTVRLYK